MDEVEQLLTDAEARKSEFVNWLTQHFPRVAKTVNNADLQLWFCPKLRRLIAELESEVA